MILIDRDIRLAIQARRIEVHPFDASLVQPASYDFRLSPKFLVFDPQVEVIDPRADSLRMQEVEVSPASHFVLHPGQFALAASIERFSFAGDIVGQVNGKSSLGRLGLQVHATAGFFDPGWDGVATLELSNVAPLPIRLYPGMKIGQMTFIPASGMAERPYGSSGLGSRYQGQPEVTMSRYAVDGGR